MSAFEKVAELKYDELVALYVIEHNDLTKEIFEDTVKTPFSMLYKFIKDGGEMMSQETKDFIYEIFERIISTRHDFSDHYKRVQAKCIITPKQEVIEETKPVEVIEVTLKKEKKLPRRYGKDKILKDIKDQGSPATPLQRAMIDLNDVRNLYVKLSDRGIKDLLGGGQNFTEEDCRKISAIVKTFKQQAEAIINKKTK